VSHRNASLPRLPGWLPSGLWGLAVLVVLGWAWAQLMDAVDGFRFDDAYITLRYARNLAQHATPSFNLDDRVDGYASPAWMLLLSGLLRIGCDGETGMLAVSRWLGFASVVGAIVWARAIGATLAMSVAVAGLGVLGTTGFLVWSAPGMEMPLVSCAALGLLLVHTQPCQARLGRYGGATSAAAAVLAGLARPETTVLAVAFLAADAVSLARKPASRPHSLLPTAAATGLLLAWFVGRWWYYGYPLPNVYYAKPATSQLLHRGLRDAWNFALTRGLGAAPVVALVLAARGRARVSLWAFVGWFAVTLAGYTRAGGDYMGFHRYYQPLVPASWAVLAAGASALADRLGRRHSMVHGVAALPLGALLLLSGVQPTRAALRDNVGAVLTSTAYVSCWREVGLALRAHYPPNTLIAVRSAGIIPWVSGLPTMDTLAPNNKLVAHGNFPIRALPGHQLEATRAQVLSSKPDVIVEHPDVVDAGAPCTHERPEYIRAGYTRVRVPLLRDDRYVCVFERPHLSLLKTHHSQNHTASRT
jgi:arabinofuranosyltransferase